MTKNKEKKLSCPQGPVKSWRPVYPFGEMKFTHKKYSLYKHAINLSRSAARLSACLPAPCCAAVIRFVHTPASCAAPPPGAVRCIYRVSTSKNRNYSISLIFSASSFNGFYENGEGIHCRSPVLTAVLTVVLCKTKKLCL